MMQQPPQMQQQGMPMQQQQQQPQQGQGQGQPPAMPNAEPEVLRNLMINYIPGNVDEMQLRQLFEMYGPIETVKVVRDRESRQSKGFGFVKYRFAGSAGQALQNLNGYPLLNKRLKVAFAQPAEAQGMVGQMPQQQQQGFAQAPPQMMQQHQQQPQQQMQQPQQ